MGSRGSSLYIVIRAATLASAAARNRSVTMPIDVLRRDFLKGAAAIAGATGGFSCVGISLAAPLEVPTVDKLAIRVLLDSSFDLFFRPTTVKGVAVAAPPRTDFRRSLHNEWGLALFLESQRGDEQRNLMLDFGYSPTLLLNNMDICGVDADRAHRNPGADWLARCSDGRNCPRRRAGR
jgi:hypothetical protein